MEMGLGVKAVSLEVRDITSPDLPKVRTFKNTAKMINHAR
jgi:hypothetical protein